MAEPHCEAGQADALGTVFAQGAACALRQRRAEDAQGLLAVLESRGVGRDWLEIMLEKPHRRTHSSLARGVMKDDFK